MSPQAERLSKKFTELLTRHGEKEINAKEAVEEVMLDNIKADRDKLPHTGCSPDLEFQLSSIFIDINTERVRPMRLLRLHPNNSIPTFNLFSVDRDVTVLEALLLYQLTRAVRRPSMRGIWKTVCGRSILCNTT